MRRGESYSEKKMETEEETKENKLEKELKKAKVNKNIIKIGKILGKSLRNSSITFAGVYFINEGLIPGENIDYLKNTIYAGEILGGLFFLSTAYFQTLKEFFPKIYENSINRIPKT
jgi:hypothetical protein